AAPKLKGGLASRLSPFPVRLGRATGAGLLDSSSLAVPHDFEPDRSLSPPNLLAQSIQQFAGRPYEQPVYAESHGNRDRDRDPTPNRAAARERIGNQQDGRHGKCQNERPPHSHSPAVLPVLAGNSDHKK